MTDHELLPEDEADLAALADDRLDPARRAQVEARLAADPDLAAAFERQLAARSAISYAVADTSAPLALRERLARLEEQRARPRRRRPAFSLGRWLAPAAAAAAAVAIAVTLIVPSGLTVEATLAAADRPPVARVMSDPQEPALLRDEVDGVRFPNFAAKFGWRPVGSRTDEIDGRRTRTVFYRRGGETVAYTIVSGDALEEPDGEPVVREGVALRTFDEDGRTVVTWRRNGRTCVMSARGVDSSTLLELASWKGKGAVRF